ncbi:Cell number regulator 6 [Linum perenne]
MGDGGISQSRYVKLTKEQAPSAEDITPGELNQPIQVPQVTLSSSSSRCHECGQPLPESYEPPADEDWTTGLCACTEDYESCRKGVLCPCVLFGNNMEALREDMTWKNACMCHAIFVEGGMSVAAATVLLAGNGIDIRTSFLICEALLFAWWMCGIYNGLFRQSLQKKYHLKDSPCDPCLVHCCCLHWCALCQEHREMRNHLSHQTSSHMTVINPPSIQQMTTAATATATQPVLSESGHLTLQIQPL